MSQIQTPTSRQRQISRQRPQTSRVRKTSTAWSSRSVPGSRIDHSYATMNHGALAPVSDGGVPDIINVIAPTGTQSLYDTDDSACSAQEHFLVTSHNILPIKEESDTDHNILEIKEETNNDHNIVPIKEEPDSDHYILQIKHEADTDHNILEVKQETDTGHNILEVKEETDHNILDVKEKADTGHNILEITQEADTDHIYTIEELKRQTTLIEETTGFLACFNKMQETLLPVRFVSVYEGENVNIKTSVTFRDDNEAVIYVHRKLLHSRHFIWSKYPNHFSSCTDITNFLSYISKLQICVGNNDSELISAFPAKSEVAYIDVYDAGSSYTKTVRSRTCDLLTNNLRCKSCIKYRGSLRKRKSSATPETAVSKMKCHKFMSNVELIHKVEELNFERKHLFRENKAFKDYIAKLLSRGHEQGAHEQPDQQPGQDKTEINKLVDTEVNKLVHTEVNTNVP